MNLFSWRRDPEGDLALVVCGVLAFVKYKHSTLVVWWQCRRWEEAGKYQGAS